MSESGRSSGAWRPLLLLCAVVGMLAAARQAGLGHHLDAVRDWIQGLGPWAPVAFTAVYVAAVVAAVPGSALYVVAGDAGVQGMRQGRVPWMLVGIVAGVSILLAGAAWMLRGRLEGDGSE